MLLIEDASAAYVFCNNYLKYSFVKFLSIFSSFQYLHIVICKWDIGLSSSYDGWNKREYTMWCLREGTSILLNYHSLTHSLKLSKLGGSGFILLKAEIKRTT